MNEIYWTRKLCRELRDNHGAIIKAIVGGSLSGEGWPDRYLHHGLIGCGLWLEFKGEKTKLEPLQKHTICELNRLIEFSAFVIRFPNKIEYYENVVSLENSTIGLKELYYEFDSTAKGLLDKLILIRKDSASECQGNRPL